MDGAITVESCQRVLSSKLLFVCCYHCNMLKRKSKLSLRFHVSQLEIYEPREVTKTPKFDHVKRFSS